MKVSTPEGRPRPFHHHFYRKGVEGGRDGNRSDDRTPVSGTRDSDPVAEVSTELLIASTRKVQPWSGVSQDGNSSRKGVTSGRVRYNSRWAI